ncbi:4-(cytidine 5'-diphospho)-2-C-methyl-D-erythritol kinase [Acidaminococcus sp. LBK-2]|uniref:4-(cytidine 5'-diphospho)-2-C-methyl-D-erythritol kinase n=1 Tax=Acidaminococcus sp. LBK-2 TaxID=3456956 RepID=UPI003FA43B8A
MKETAFGKINLGLSVLGRRTDSYHQVDMIMQSISLADCINFVPAEAFGVETDDPGLPCDGSNLMVKAAWAFAQRTGKPISYHLTCAKRIFLAAGLAGGSTDAAAVLRGLNDLSGKPLDRAALEELAASIGSDVPFCLYGGTQRARGRGERMTVLPAVPRLDMVLVKPRDLEVSTTWVYGEIDKIPGREPLDIQGLERAIRQGDRQGILDRMGNDLEKVTVARYPVLRKLKEQLQGQGAEKTLMSGSGPTVFGIFPDRETAGRAAESLKKQAGDLQIELAHTVQEE